MIDGYGFRHGIGAHSPREIVFDLKSELSGFKKPTGFAGPDAKRKGAMEFKVLLDGKQTLPAVYLEPWMLQS